MSQNDVHLIQIVPGLPPRIDGIGDYALQLAKRLYKISGIKTSFLVADSSWRGQQVESFSATSVPRQSSEALIEALERIQSGVQRAKTAVLLHFSPYGYQLRGCPFWLAKGLEHWKEQNAGTIHVGFHELAAHSRRPWSSTFWVPPLQRSIVKRVARIGTFLYTNTESHRTDLESWGSGRIAIIPNFSTMGEPEQNTPFHLRQRNLVIFGRAAQRHWTYTRGAAALRLLCEQLEIEQIVDIGPPVEIDDSLLHGGILIRRCGRIEAHEVDQWMASSLGSFMYYPVPLLTKSSVHAVSCAHGTIPFVFDDSAIERSCPGLVSGEDFIAVREMAVDLSGRSLEEVSAMVYRNYRMRTSSAAATLLSERIRSQHGKGDDCERTVFPQSKHAFGSLELVDLQSKGY